MDTESRPVAEPESWPLDAMRRVALVVAGASVAFVTSANLSQAAMDHSLEVGLLVRGGPVPERLTGHFHGLIARGELQRL